MSGIGKTTAARALARRYDLRLYSLDARTYQHAARLPPETRTLDELWVDTTPPELADWFERSSRDRFRLVVDDLLALPADAPVIADGPQLLPDLVAPLLASPRQALFVIARPELQQRLVKARGSDLYARTRDPERALENRLARDQLLAAHLRETAQVRGLTAVGVDDVSDTRPAIERHFEPFLRNWLAHGDLGDVSSRRRDENDARLKQWRAHLDATGAAPSGEIDLACECTRSGCDLIVRIGLIDAEASRAQSRPLVADAHL
jgi:hypoxanthine phosphoribosyltransferase